MSRHSHFTTGGQPFFSVGCQTRNSCSYFPEKMEDTWTAARLLHANTVATPIPWERFEPEEENFDEQYVRDLIDQARAHGVKLSLLWFGTWKNGSMEYTPNWVKTAPDRFPRAELRDGSRLHQLSVHSRANLENDKRAFCHLLKVLKEYDGKEQTVIAVQVENEPGILGGTRRDFSPMGEEAYHAQVPEKVIQWCKDHPDDPVSRQWTGAENGNWQEVFGIYGAEACTAAAIAQYIDEIAGAGKEVYDIFLYMNVWQDGYPRGFGTDIGGVDWPAGGANIRNLGIYYALVSSLDTISPDNYHGDLTRYLTTTSAYAHPENGFPLYVPESARGGINASLMFDAIGNHGALGYHIFGSEQLLTADRKNLIPEANDIMYSLAMLRNVAGILPDYLGTDRLAGIAQQPGEVSCLLENFNGWKIVVGFPGSGIGGNDNSLDYRHESYEPFGGMKPFGEDLGRGLIFAAGEDEFYLVGHRIRLFFLEREAEDGSLSVYDLNGFIRRLNGEYLYITEGHFDEDGKYVTDIIRSGDEARNSVWAHWDCGVIHVKLLKMR